MPDTAQFLPLGEVLGAIPGGKPAGAWARVIGLALSNFWRRQPRETIRAKADAPGTLGVLHADNRRR